MPLYEPLHSLADICIEWVLEWLFRSLKVGAAPPVRLQQRAFIVSNLSANIRQRLLNIIFQQHMYEQNLSSKCMLLELLGDRGTRCIDFTHSGYAYIDEVWQFYRTLTVGMMINITRLGIICNIRNTNDKKYVSDVNVTFYRVFNQMKCLRWVTLAGVADTTMLTTLGMNCPHLEYLDVNDSIKVDDHAIAKLVLSDPYPIIGKTLSQLARQKLKTNPCASVLRKICINGTITSPVGVLVLLHYVQNLESFGGDIDAGCISKVVECLQPENGKRMFKLRELCDSKLHPDRAALLHAVCPDLTNITTEASSLEHLHIMENITSLTLNVNFRDHINDFYYYLCWSGSYLKEINLINHLNCRLDINWFIEVTPNLEHLEATVCMDDEAEFPEDVEVPYWSRLRVARITVESGRVLACMLTHAPQITDLHIKFNMIPYTENYECINDDLIIDIVVSEGLLNLEKLWISECAISLKGIECLLLHCPRLKLLAPITFWHGLTEEAIEALHRQIKRNNWDLKLIMRVAWEQKRKPLEVAKIMEYCTVINGVD